MIHTFSHRTPRLTGNMNKELQSPTCSLEILFVNIRGEMAALTDIENPVPNASSRGKIVYIFQTEGSILNLCFVSL